TTVDDTPYNGTTIKVYKDGGDGVRGGDDVLKGTTTTANIGGVDGSYSFTGLAAGRYFVEETVPSGYVRTNPHTKDYYTVDVTSSATTFTGKDFANFKQCNPCSISVTNYSILRAGAT